MDLPSVKVEKTVEGLGLGYLEFNFGHSKVSILLDIKMETSGRQLDMGVWSSRRYWG